MINIVQTLPKYHIPLLIVYFYKIHIWNAIRTCLNHIKTYSINSSLNLPKPAIFQSFKMFDMYFFTTIYSTNDNQYMNFSRYWTWRARARVRACVCECVNGTKIMNGNSWIEKKNWLRSTPFSIYEQAEVHVSFVYIGP